MVDKSINIFIVTHKHDFIERIHSPTRHHLGHVVGPSSIWRRVALSFALVTCFRFQLRSRRQIPAQLASTGILIETGSS